MRLRRPVCLSDGRRDDEIVDAIMATAEPGIAAASYEKEEERGKERERDFYSQEEVTSRRRSTS